MSACSAIGLPNREVLSKTGSQKGPKMRYLKVLTLLGISSLCLAAIPYAQAQGSGSRVAPDYPNQGSANPAYNDPGYGNQCNNDPSYNDPGYADQGNGNPGYDDPGYGNQPNGNLTYGG